MASILGTEHDVHGHDHTQGSNTALVVVLLLIVLLVLLFFGLPALRNLGTGQGPQINIPPKVDINVNQGQPPQQPQ